MNQLLHQYYPDYFIRANCKLSLLASPRRRVTPSPSTAEGTPRKQADLPFTQDSVNRKTRFQNVNPLLIPIFFFRMKSRRPHLAHLLVPGSRGLDSFALFSPLRLPFILSASSGFWLPQPSAVELLLLLVRGHSSE